MILIEASEEDEGKRLDKFLCQKFDIPFSLGQKLIREKKVRVNGSREASSYKVCVLDEVKVFSDLKDRIVRKRKKARVSQQKINRFLSSVIFEDDDILAINKPSGLAVQGGSSIDVSVDDILTAINKAGSLKKLQLVHRLDKDTSGVLLIAKGKEAASYLISCFKNKKIEKTYLALVQGPLNKEEGVIDIPLRKKFVKKVEKVYPDFESGRVALTKFRLLRRFYDFSLLELKPVTGRTHQLRVHCKELGHAILNDVKYGGKKVLAQDISDRLCLHASVVEFIDYNGSRLVIEAPKPDFLEKI